MAKRFTETGKWTKAWFRSLTPIEKCFWFYILDNCDFAGFWNEDWGAARFYVGAEVDKDHMLSVFGDRLEQVEDKIFVRDFVGFQYGNIDTSSRIHKKIRGILEKNGKGDVGVTTGLPQGDDTLTKGLRRGDDRVQDMDMDMDMDKEKDMDMDMDMDMDIKERVTTPYQRGDDRVTTPLPQGDDRVTGSGSYPPNGIITHTITVRIIKEALDFLVLNHQYVKSPADTRHAEQILMKIESILKSQAMKDEIVGPAEILHAFKYLINNLDDWTKEKKFSLKYIANNFNEVYHAARAKATGKTAKPKRGGLSVEEEARLRETLRG